MSSSAYANCYVPQRISLRGGRQRRRPVGINSNTAVGDACASASMICKLLANRDLPFPKRLKVIEIWLRGHFIVRCAQKMRETGIVSDGGVVRVRANSNTSLIQSQTAFTHGTTEGRPPPPKRSPPQCQRRGAHTRVSMCKSRRKHPQP